jgi:hypothetical protein
MAWVKILKEVMINKPGNWQLCFHWCEYHYDNTPITEDGYRFIWRRPNGNLQAARGQARIPSWNEMNQLFALARSAGWLETIENV